ncbi:hypothetical protein GOE00_12065 [Sinorhizobium medicae]|uniref:hypothetical protein n=1 Tax=Sinorhizobium medicae TaxID=110321 RepID=UPI000FD9778B|nr:hypothetical protein [Sinorhizobium medicae]MBO1945187.1 hypothetical protein [Sinorhizobium medicae]MDX0528348.1 hypothetical protein [Sinorhizobium medicae]MDX0867479.1 hypothetical protein [Sinorhizobium medicae]MDX0885487.1 hypothetical protein [Sinorhizobium medicae]MDX0891576.1 hypothetical protein [Sinorhizobium medicae]
MTIANIAAVLLALTALYGMQHSTPSYSEVLSPVAVPAAQGKLARTGRFVFAVAKVHSAWELVVPSLGEPRTYTTSGKWLVIEAAAKAQEQSVSLTSAEWRGPSGLRFAMSGRIGGSIGLLGSERLEPGIPRPVLLVFELPEDQIESGTLLVAETTVAPLAEQVEIAMHAVLPENRHESITLARGGRIMPWMLEF